MTLTKMTNDEFLKRLGEYRTETRKLDGTYQNVNNCFIVCDSLSENHYLVGVADLPGRKIDFHIIDILGIAYLIPSRIAEECWNIMLNYTSMRLELTKNTLETILYWLLPRLQEFFKHAAMVALSENVPQYILDLFYDAKRYEIFDKVRKKFKEDAEKEENEQG